MHYISSVYLSQLSICYLDNLYHFYPYMCDIIFDQSARSISTRCHALVATCQFQTLVFETKRIMHLLLYCEEFI